MKNNRNRLFSNGLFYIVLFLMILWGINWALGGSPSTGTTSQISYSTFVKELKNGEIKSFDIQPANGVYTVNGQYREAKESKSSNNQGLLGIVGGSSSKITKFSTTMLQNDSVVKAIDGYASENNTKISTQGESQSSNWLNILLTVVPTIIFIFLLWKMMPKQGGRGGGGIMNFGRSQVKPEDPKKNKVRFDDVAGEDEEKQELVEVVDFLKNPAKYTRLGAKLPSGVLLEGPPGTGKTLLARAVAGEAGVPFFSISGSDFVEMFVGVGASRVRDLFSNAKKSAPSIIFIDEIDAIGRRRGNGIGGGNDEREQTLNQLLVEMDGFRGDEGVIIIAATNRADVLDPALLRPGRFDRKVTVDAPDVRGREAILKVHAKNKPLADDVDLKQIARQTPGFVGADLANILNEAALVAARSDAEKVHAKDIDEAIDRVIAGLAKKDLRVGERTRNTVAIHEAGHAIVGLVLNHSDKVRKVTIIPHGNAGGYNLMMPNKEEEWLSTKSMMFEEIAGFMGGRAAEKLFCEDISTGASDDFEKATRIARSMVMRFGMTDELGMVSWDKLQQTEYMEPYSQATSAAADQAVKKILNDAYEKAIEVIKAHTEQHKVIKDALLEYETLHEKEIQSLFKTGKMPNEVEEEYPSEKDSDDTKTDETKPVENPTDEG
ncbi:MAG: ATP-dependent zinc metalloprotease FtsH [Lactobacillus sp.]|nr:ATP-dependent zinc metalloprotease FtsH [Lactobacillus sp.]